ncbi:MAG: hypothetical protein HON46_06015 [Gammaproteobacteria bacterium]|jgi:hypothetical protein|nr:hypothetical protein [Gammaproteobacteria bacterium]
MDINATKQQLISLVKKINSENPSLSIEFHQQKVTKKNMCVRGKNGSLWIEPYSDWYDIGLSGQSLTKEMTGFMENICGKKAGNKQSKPEPSHHPFWRVNDFKVVESSVYRYAGVKG